MWLVDGILLKALLQPLYLIATNYNTAITTVLSPSKMCLNLAKKTALNLPYTEFKINDLRALLPSSWKIKSLFQPPHNALRSLLGAPWRIVDVKIVRGTIGCKMWSGLVIPGRTCSPLFSYCIYVGLSLTILTNQGN